MRLAAAALFSGGHEESSDEFTVTGAFGAQIKQRVKHRADAHCTA